MRFKQKKAQSITEYAVIVAAVVAALMFMSVYVSRSKKGHLKKYADSIGTQYSLKKSNYNKVTHMTMVGGEADTRGMNVTTGREADYYTKTVKNKDMVNYVKSGKVVQTEVFDTAGSFSAVGGDADAISMIGNIGSKFQVSAQGNSVHSFDGDSVFGSDPQEEI